MKIKHIETGEVFEVVRFSGEYWIDDTGYIESDQLGISWKLVDDYKQLYEQQKQRADELENTLAHIKSHLDNLWYNGDASEHEYAANTLKYIESLQENNNA